MPTGGAAGAAIDLTDIVLDTRGLLGVDTLCEAAKCVRIEHLAFVDAIALCVDAEANPIGDFGAKLPRLRSLKLSWSRIPSLADLGTSLRNVTVLSVDHVHLQRLEGICALPSLRELHAAYNFISDAGPLSFLEHLSFVDLEANNIRTVADIQSLALCEGLTDLVLTGCPVEFTQHYRSTVAYALPFLDRLDYQLLDRDNYELGFDPVTVAEASEWALPLMPPLLDQLKVLVDESGRGFDALQLVETELHEDRLLFASTAAFDEERGEPGAPGETQTQSRAASPLIDTLRGETKAANRVLDRDVAANSHNEQCQEAAKFADGGPELFADDYHAKLTRAARRDVRSSKIDELVVQAFIKSLTSPPFFQRDASYPLTHRPPAGASTLTHHTQALFCGKPTKSLKCFRRFSTDSADEAVDSQTRTADSTLSFVRPPVLSFVRDIHRTPCLTTAVAKRDPWD